MTKLYGTDFYERIALGSSRSAEIILPPLVERFEVTSAVDVGCGAASWLASLQQLGINDVTGIDGPWALGDTLRIGPENFVECDLSAAFPQIDRRFDLALCTEVAEHLPSEKSEGIVELLCSLSDVVVFPAAIPFQGGIGHINQQWQSFWADLFRARGYGTLDIVRPAVWTNSEVEFWYRQNLLVFANGAPDDVAMIDVIHPAMAERGLSRSKHPAELFARRQAAKARQVTSVMLDRLRGN